jgi:chorismate--pyruvate lyase
MLNLQQPWQTADQFRFVNANQQAWLCQQGSLTAALRQQHSAIKVEIVQQGLSEPRDWEAHALALSQPQPCWLRQVYLQNPSQNLIAARTVVANFEPTNPWYPLHSLGNQPLGERLFSLPNLTRSAFAFSYMHSPHHTQLYPARYCFFS